MRYRNIALTSVVLLATWFLWSGHFDPLFIGFGVTSTALVVMLAARLDILDEEGLVFALGWRQLAYLPWLAWEVAKANLAVAKLIVSPRLALRPKVVRLRASQRHPVAKVIYANSITLTPGTITLDVRQKSDGKMLVHALTNEGAYELVQGTMDRRVTRIEAHLTEPEP